MREKVKRYNFSVGDSGPVRGYESEHGRRVKRVEYFRAPPAHPDAALVEAMQLLEVLRGRIGGALWSLDSEDRELAERTDRAIAALAGKGGE